QQAPGGRFSLAWRSLQDPPEPGARSPRPAADQGRRPPPPGLITGGSSPFMGKYPAQAGDGAVRSPVSGAARTALSSRPPAAPGTTPSPASAAAARLRSTT